MYKCVKRLVSAFLLGCFVYLPLHSYERLLISLCILMSAFLAVLSLYLSIVRSIFLAVLCLYFFILTSTFSVVLSLYLSILTSAFLAFLSLYLSILTSTILAVLSLYLSILVKNTQSTHCGLKQCFCQDNPQGAPSLDILLLMY
jgi:hypothetical protein